MVKFEVDPPRLKTQVRIYCRRRRAHAAARKPEDQRPMDTASARAMREIGCRHLPTNLPTFAYKRHVKMLSQYAGRFAKKPINPAFSKIKSVLIT
jgi:hypothetical protein